MLVSFHAIPGADEHGILPLVNRDRRLPRSQRCVKPVFCRSLVRSRCLALSCCRALGLDVSAATVRSSRAPLASHLLLGQLLSEFGAWLLQLSELRSARESGAAAPTTLARPAGLDNCWTFACCLQPTLSFLFFSGLSRLLQIMLLSRFSAGSPADVEGSLEPC